MSKKQIAVLTVIAIAVGAWFYFDLASYLQLEVVQQRIDELRAWYVENPLRAGAIYFAVYVAVTALSVPGAAVMTLAGGALFWGALFAGMGLYAAYQLFVVEWSEPDDKA